LFIPFFSKKREKLKWRGNLPKQIIVERRVGEKNMLMMLKERREKGSGRKREKGDSSLQHILT